ncbi:MAG: signal peptidase I [Elusimicrobia bacterium]|nr:signal peptidase I [Elusimicrobiota bacterium]
MPQIGAGLLACLVALEQRSVRGRSMAGLLEPGQKVDVLMGYYRCRRPRRGEWVLFRHSGRETPSIKIVKAVPGDRFELKEKAGSWSLWINGALAVNSEGMAYRFDERARSVLSAYQKSHDSCIPPEAYLLLGNQPGGSLDSGRLGLVGRAGILGKALPP